MGDSYSKYEEILSEYRLTRNDSKGFWDGNGVPALEYDLLDLLLSKSLSDGDKPQSGSFAKALDMWTAEQLRFAGFEEEEVWPRRVEPRVLDPEVLKFIDSMPLELAEHCRDRLRKKSSSNANVQGAVYQKQIDVGMSTWLTGPEILISTKTMCSSFGKNLANRFEEAYGDAMNLRKRYPMAAIGFVFLVSDEIRNSSSDFSKAISMLTKLQEDEIYNCTAMILVDIENEKGIVDRESGLVPRSLSPEIFFSKIIEHTLLYGNINAHSLAREVKGMTPYLYEYIGFPR